MTESELTFEKLQAFNGIWYNIGRNESLRTLEDYIAIREGRERIRCMEEYTKILDNVISQLAPVEATETEELPEVTDPGVEDSTIPCPYTYCDHEKHGLCTIGGCMKNPTYLNKLLEEREGEINELHDALKGLFLASPPALIFPHPERYANACKIAEKLLRNE